MRDDFSVGFVYSDAWVQDARLVVLNAMDAAQRGARIETHTTCVSARRDGDGWIAELQARDGTRHTVKARALVNAAGPWAASFLDDVVRAKHSRSLRLIKGSHIVVPKIYDHRYAYIFQQPDRRIVFAIPYERDFTLIGTTDIEYKGDPSRPTIDAEETQYLCDATNRYFKKQLTPNDVVWTYSGVRPLLQDESGSASEVTRDYLLDVDQDGAPLLNVFGGKLTTFRKLAEEAVDKLAPLLGNEKPAWTADARPLPGGGERDVDALTDDIRASRPWLSEAFAWRLTHSYGTRARDLLGEAKGIEALGEHFGADLYQAEVDYLVRHEWVTEAEDILWRRSKIGLRVGPDDVRRLTEYLTRRAP
jgi:glycerol-3-phosphate dehydrogenase